MADKAETKFNQSSAPKPKFVKMGQDNTGSRYGQNPHKKTKGGK